MTAQECTIILRWIADYFARRSAYDGDRWHRWSHDLHQIIDGLEQAP